MHNSEYKEWIQNIHKIQLQILLEFDRICKKNGLKYHLTGGTLLGCIRHNGFIPWDDDIDVCMLRKDYNRFVDACASQLNSEYFVQSSKTDKYYPYPFLKIRKNNTVLIENFIAEYPIHQGVFIDVFPLDNVFPYSIVGKIHLRVCNILAATNFCRNKKTVKYTDKKMERWLIQVLYFFLKLVPKAFTDVLQQKMFTMFEKKDAVFAVNLTLPKFWKSFYTTLRRKTEFNQTLDGEFEGYVFPIPANYDALLSSLYGNYMELPAEEERKPHHKIPELKIIKIKKILPNSENANSKYL